MALSSVSVSSCISFCDNVANNDAVSYYFFESSKLAGLCKLVQAFDHGFLFALNTLVKSSSFEDNICAVLKVCCKMSFYGLLDLITFGELKASTCKDFVHVSTHSVDQRVYLHFLIFFVEASIAIAFKACDQSFPLLRFL